MRPSGRIDYGCRPCMNETSTRWVEENREAMYIQQAASRYGISAEEAARLRAMSCEVCGSKDRMVIDHQHGTGQVRGALCNSCNSALGHAKDSPTTLRALAEYLENRGSDGE